MRPINFYVVLLCIALAIGAALGWWLKPCSAPVVAGATVRVEHTIDTVYRVVLRPAIVVDRMRPQVTVDGPSTVTWVQDAPGSLDRDTLTAQPFTATIDTVIDRDTIHAQFTFPPPAFSLALRRPADSIMERNVQTIVTQQVVQAPGWYEEAGKILLGAAVGYGVRWATEPK